MYFYLKGWHRAALQSSAFLHQNVKIFKCSCRSIPPYLITWAAALGDWRPATVQRLGCDLCAKLRMCVHVGQVCKRASFWNVTLYRSNALLLRSRSLKEESKPNMANMHEQLGHGSTALLSQHVRRAGYESIVLSWWVDWLISHSRWEGLYPDAGENPSDSGSTLNLDAFFCV